MKVWGAGFALFCSLEHRAPQSTLNLQHNHLADGKGLAKKQQPLEVSGNSRGLHSWFQCPAKEAETRRKDLTHTHTGK